MKTYEPGQRRLIFVTVVTTKDLGHHTIDVGNVRCNPSREALTEIEPGIADIPILEALLSGLRQREAEASTAAPAGAPTAA